MKIIAQIAIVLAVCLSVQGVDTFLSIKQQTNNVILYWNAVPNSEYQIEQREQSGWTTNAILIASKTNESKVVSILPNTHLLFRLQELSPIRGGIILTNGTRVADTIQVKFNVRSAGANIQYVQLLGVTGNKTNSFGEIDMLRSPTNSFTVDTTRLQSGITNLLFMRVVDNYNDTNGTSDNVRMVYTEPVAVVPQNLLSLPGFTSGVEGRIAFKIAPFPSFAASSRFHLWVNIRDESGNVVIGKDGGRELVNANGFIIVEDEENEGYGYENVLFNFDIYAIDDTRAFQFWFTEPVVKWPLNNGFVVEQPNRFVSNNVHANMLGRIMLETQHGHVLNWHLNQMLPVNDQWSVMNSGSVWSNLNWFISGPHIPAFGHFWCQGGPTRLGSLNSNENLFGSSIPQRNFRFVFVDGCNLPLGVISKLTDTLPRKREEYVENGKMFKCGLYWEGYPFGEMKSPDTNHVRFMIDFYTRLAKVGPSGFHQTTVREAIDFASSPTNNPAGPSIRRYLRHTGCLDFVPFYP